MPKINMEKFTILLNHVVSRVSVSNAHHISGNKVPNTGFEKILFSNSQLFFILVHFLKIFKGGLIIKSLHNFIRILLMNMWTVLSILDNFNEANSILGRQNLVYIHFKIHIILDPNFIKNRENLQSQMILFDIIAILEHNHIIRFICFYPPLLNGSLCLLFR